MSSRSGSGSAAGPHLAGDREQPEQRLRRPEVLPVELEQPAQRLGGGLGAAELDRERGVLAAGLELLLVGEPRPALAEQLVEGLLRAGLAVERRQLADDVEVVGALLAVAGEVAAGLVELARAERARRREAHEPELVVLGRGLGVGVRNVERGGEILEREVGLGLLGEVGAADERGDVGRVLLERLGEQLRLARGALGELRGREEQLRRRAPLVEQGRAAGEQRRGVEAVAARELELGEGLERRGGLARSRRGLEHRLEADLRRAGVARLEQPAGALQEQRRGVLGAAGLEERVGALRPEVGELAGAAGLVVERLEPGGELVVELPRGERGGVVLDRGVAVSEQVAGLAEPRADLGDPLGGRVAREPGEHVLEGSARVGGPLAAHREVGEVEEHARLGREPGGLLERDERLAAAAEPGLEHARELAQRGGGEPLVAGVLGGAGPLLERGGEADHVRALALERAELAEGGQIVGLEREHLGERVRGEVVIEGQVARGDREAAVVADPVLALGGELGERAEAAAELLAVAAALGEREQPLERGAVARVGVERGVQPLLRLVRLVQPAAVELGGLGPERGLLLEPVDDRGGLLARVGELGGAAGGAEVRDQLLERDEVARIERERGLEVLAAPGGVAELLPVQARERVVRRRGRRGGSPRCAARGRRARRSAGSRRSPRAACRAARRCGRRSRAARARRGGARPPRGSAAARSRAGAAPRPRRGRRAGSRGRRGRARGGPSRRRGAGRAPSPRGGARRSGGRARRGGRAPRGCRARA